MADQWLTRRFTLTRGEVVHFWDIGLRENALRVRHGQEGHKARHYLKELAGPAQARKAYDRLVRRRLAQGYVEVLPRPAGRGLLEALEEALVADPDDLAAHMAYADYLTEQGDPRGEFIQVQLALEDEGKSAAERKKLQTREKALLKRHLPDWLGELAPFLGDDARRQDRGFRFARGWLDELVFDSLLENVARAMRGEPRLRLLRALTVADNNRMGPGSFKEDAPDDSPRTPADRLDILARSPYLGNIRVLHLGTTEGFVEDQSEPVYFDDYWDLNTIGYRACEWIGRLPRLEELYVRGDLLGARELFRSGSWSRLRVLHLSQGENYPLEVLAGNPALGGLEVLSLRPRREEPGEGPGLPQVGALLRSPHLPALTHLRLQECDMSDRGCAVIVASGILRRLEFLDLAHGRITDRGARTLADCPDLRRLHVLDVSHNALSPAGVGLLASTGICVRASHQHPEDEDP